MQEISKSAYRYAIALYVIVAAYFWYLFHSLWLFLGKNYFPQDVSSVLSIQNSNFNTVNLVLSSVFAIVLTTALVMYTKLREFFIDVGDELSRVAWPTFKEAQKSTAIVVLLVIVMGFALFFADTIFMKIVHYIMSTAA